MSREVLDAPPGSLGLYARAGLGSLPLVSSLPIPWVGGGRAKDVPDRELALEGVEIDRNHLAQYSEVCGFRLRDELPPTYPHMLAFGLHMSLLTDPHFPFPAIGLVHISNSIDQRRPIGVGEKLDVSVHATKLEPHPKGRQFSLITEVRSGGELVWSEVSTNLRRGGGSENGSKKSSSADGAEKPELRVAAEWKLDGGLGRRYAAASGDRNPIHLYGLTAKAFGFPAQIAHGMWSKARCLAALEGRLPGAFTTEASFKKPIVLPAKVEFLTNAEATAYGLRNPKDGSPHLDGSVTPA